MQAMEKSNQNEDSDEPNREKMNITSTNQINGTPNKGKHI